MGVHGVNVKTPGYLLAEIIFKFFQSPSVSVQSPIIVPLECTNGSTTKDGAALPFT